MNEILFRGKSNTHDWVFGSLVSINDSEALIIPEFDQYSDVKILNLVEENGKIVMRDTVGMYSGKKCIDGTKIFDGDIVLIESIYYKKKFYGLAQVYYLDEMAAWFAYYPKDENWWKPFIYDGIRPAPGSLTYGESDLLGLKGTYNHMVKVIGNRWDGINEEYRAILIKDGYDGLHS